MSQASVLIVDDEPEFLEVMAERMSGRGFEVFTAVNGAEALDKLREQKFDAIVMDLMMPGLDGIEALKRIRNEHPDMQVILLTGAATVQKGVEAVKSGAMDFLEKPADLDELSEKIREAKERRVLLVESQREDAVRQALSRYGV